MQENVVCMTTMELNKLITKFCQSVSLNISTKDNIHLHSDLSPHPHSIQSLPRCWRDTVKDLRYTPSPCVDTVSVQSLKQNVLSSNAFLASLSIYICNAFSKPDS